MYKIGIIGCGLIGNKRAKTLKNHELVIVCDHTVDKAKKLAEEYNCEYTIDYHEVISKVDIVIVSTPNNMLVPIAIDAVKQNKHVIIEKPGARNAEEFKKLVDAAAGTDVIVKVGFNHRYHPALLKAKEIVESRVFGDIMFIRARYGHGGRIGYDKEWRAKKNVSGGGQLLDQGCHLIDLGQIFMGYFSEVQGYTTKYFWDMEVEDNAFLLMKTPAGQIMQMHASWTEWKNMFSFEIMCRTGKVEISGLGRSYGVEKLIVYKMLPEMGPPVIDTYTFDGEDESFQMEFDEFIKSVESSTKTNDLETTYEIFKVIEKVYDQNPENTN